MATKKRKNNSDAEIKKAKNLYTSFMWGKEPGAIRKTKMPELGTMVEIGRVREIYYDADKNNGPNTYKHRFSRPYPYILASIDRKHILLTGGKLRVRDEGITG